jgi:hypothetical protein
MVPEAYCWLFIYCIVRCGVDSDARLEEVLRCSNQSVLQNPPALRRCDKSFADSRVIPEYMQVHMCLCYKFECQAWEQICPFEIEWNDRK